MNEKENPFKYRHEEQIDKDPIFIKLFGPNIIELIPLDSFMKKATLFVSAPGGGKSSLFRIFKPYSLLTIINYHDNEDYSDLFEKLRQLDVISATKPTLLGIYLSCARNYSELELLKFDDLQKNHLFFSLISARLILIALQGILELNNLTIEDLERISISRPSQVETLPKSPLPCNGKTLYDWASNIENSICEILDSYEQNYNKDISITNNLEFLHALNPANILLDGKPIVEHTLIMLDDVNFLSKTQRDNFLSILKKHQLPLPIWIADRKESSEFTDMLPGNDGREFNIVEIERTFRSKGKQFEYFVKNVADRRSKTGILDITDFSACVDDPMTSPAWEEKFKEIIPKIRKEIETKAVFTKKYDKWILEQEKVQGSEMEKAIGWRALEIDIQRNLTGVQTTLLDIPLEIEAHTGSISAITPAAEFFISEEYGIPYYFGFSKLATLASYNIEQFIEITGNLFEEIISKQQLKQAMVLHPQEQQDLIKKIARKYWNDIPKSFTNGINASRLLDAIGKMAREQTLRPTAPYLPGVTGIGITTSNFFQIQDLEIQKNKPEYKILEETIHTCIANSLLRPEYDYKQGSKGKTTFVVLQLNRLLCVHFGLPLGLGGWRPVKPDDMSNWIMSKLVLKGEK
jgi:hypothetical protein